MMVGHMGELTLSSSTIAISLFDVTGFSFLVQNFTCSPLDTFLSSYITSPQHISAFTLQNVLRHPSSTPPSPGRQTLLGSSTQMAKATFAGINDRHRSSCTENRITRDDSGVKGLMIKRCLCLPTKHPGSFRCRHHIAVYAWGARFAAKK
ncbi:hypothetical protein V6N13_051039 [Hibiscus sabdariffa]|uniref:SWIM-type domain-containing protein n=1 Tax=Hibiscus sabdariffa TaxID=183260 RepID=A0ABR2T2F3_9ROSI